MHIAITGNLGSGKSTVAKTLRAKLGYEIYSTGTIQRGIAEEMGITTLALNQKLMTDPSLDYVIDDAVERISLECDNIIFDSRMAWHFAHNTFSVFIKVDLDEAARRIMNDDRGSVEKFATLDEAKASISERGRLERERFSVIYGVDYAAPENYDLVIDSTDATPEEIAETIIEKYSEAKALAPIPDAETVHTASAPAAIGPYCQAKTVGGLVFTSGQIPISPRTGEIVGEDIKSQTERVCINLACVLRAAGTSLDRVIKTTCFLSDMANFADFNEVYAKYFKSKPARSCVAVKALPKGVLVEVEVIAEV